SCESKPAERHHTFVRARKCQLLELVRRAHCALPRLDGDGGVGLLEGAASVRSVSACGGPSRRAAPGPSPAPCRASNDPCAREGRTSRGARSTPPPASPGTER